MRKLVFTWCSVVCLLAVGNSAFSAENKPLIYCSEGSPTGFDPSQSTSGIDFTANTLTVYNRLVEFEHGGTKVVPALATSWESSADGRSYTFHLRNGVKFQTTDYWKPTRNLNADDVVFSFERMLSPNSSFQKAYPVSFPYLSDLGMDRLIKTVTKVDDHTVRFDLNGTSAPFIQNMAMGFASILSKEYADHLLQEGRAADINQFPIGTGPFSFKSYTKDSTVRFDANNNYWDPNAVQVKRLIFSITPDAAVRAEKLKRNECQVIAAPRPSDLATLQSDPAITMPSEPGYNLAYLAFNVTKKPFDNPDVRRALALALDRAAITKSVYQGAAQVADSAMPPTQWSYKKSVSFKQDIDVAKSLLAKAGYPNGFDATLYVTSVQRTYNPNPLLMAEMIQSDWSKVNVRVKIESFELGELLKRLRSGQHDVALAGWIGDNGDPDNWLGNLLSCAAVNGSNYTKWCNQDFDALIQRGRTTLSINDRIKDYQSAQDIFGSQLPFIPISTFNFYQPKRKDVIGMKLEPLGYYRFDGVSLK